MARTLACWGAALLLLALPQHVLAMGLGGIELRSALNQPLDADIVLTSASAEDLDELRVALADQDAFSRYGLDRPAIAADMRFEVLTRADGQPVVRLTSRQPVREPFLTFLVEASWPRGRLLREYTVLLDPPAFAPAEAAEAPVATPRTAPAVPDERTGRVEREAPSPAAPPAAAPTRQPAPDGTWTVQRDDTLWGLAQQLRPESGITTNQMMVGLYEANPNAFDGNINRLRAGATLRVPDAATLRGLAAGAATARVQEHNDAWQQGVAAPAPDPRLRLVAPAEEDPLVAAGTQAGADAQARVGELEREAGELRDEVQRLREELEQSRRLIELRDEELAALQQQLGADPETPAAAPLPSTPGVDLERDDPVFADDTPAAADPDPAAEPAAPVAAETPAAPGLVERVLAGPLLWIALGLLVVLAAAVLYVKRRQQTAGDSTGRWEALEADDEALGADEERDATRRMRETPAVAAAGGAAAGLGAIAAREPEPDEPVAPAEPPATTTTGVQTDEVPEGDPVAEADFHMAYGLYDQAAELLNDAVERTPHRSDLRLKLAEVYFVWGDADAFRSAAAALRETVGDGAEWDKVMIMGKQLCPDDPMFQGATASTDLDVEFGSADGDDLSLDFEVDGDPVASAYDGLDLDVGGEGASADDARAADEFSLGIGSQTATSIEQGLLEGVDEHATAETTETPTMESPAMDSPTLETPTIETPAYDSPTVETPTVETPAYDSPTMETPTIQSPRPDLEPTREASALGDGSAGGRGLESLDAEHTAEINLDDLDLDLDGLDVSLPDEDLEATGAVEFDDPFGAADADADAATSAPRPSGTEAATDDPLVDYEATDAAMRDDDDHAVTDVGIIEEPGDDTFDEDLSAAFDAVDGAGEPGGGDAASEVDDARVARGEDTTRQQRVPGGFDDDDLLSPTGATQVLDEDAFETGLGEDDATRLAPSLADTSLQEALGDEAESTARVQVLPDESGSDESGADGSGFDQAAFDEGRGVAGRGGDLEATSEMRGLSADDLDLDFGRLGADETGTGGDTVEHPRPSLDEFGDDVFGAGHNGEAPLDLAFGDDDMDTGGDGDDDALDAVTEVGTKLDLARAYIDMGDPDGARSILDEVLGEGDHGQRQEAQQLLDSL